MWIKSLFIFSSKQPSITIKNGKTIIAKKVALNKKIKIGKNPGKIKSTVEEAIVIENDNIEPLHIVIDKYDNSYKVKRIKDSKIFEKHNLFFSEITEEFVELVKFKKYFLDNKKKISLTFIPANYFPVKKFFIVATILGIPTILFFSPLVPGGRLTSKVTGEIEYLDRNGEKLESFNKSFKSIESIPEEIIDAVIASEDQNFKGHLGFDIRGIIRATYYTFFKRSQQGGSTITQQVAKLYYSDEIGRKDAEIYETYGEINQVEKEIKQAESELEGDSDNEQLQNSLESLLDKKDDLNKKLNVLDNQQYFAKGIELITSIKLSLLNSKDDVLLAYLNKVYMGNGITGFPKAVELYLKVPSENSTLAIGDAAALAAIINQPNNYIYGICNEDVEMMELLWERRNEALSRLDIKKYPDANDVKRDSILSNFKDICLYESKENTVFNKPYTNHILEESQKKLKKFTIKNSIHLTIDKELQDNIEKTVTNFVGEPKSGNLPGINQAAVVVINSNTGEILALLESLEPQERFFSSFECKKILEPEPDGEEISSEKLRDQRKCRFYNYAIKETFSAASTFKPFAYAAALEQGISSQKNYSCRPFNFNSQEIARECTRDGSPSDTMADSIAYSNNHIAVRVLQDAGIGNSISLARKMGIKSPLNNDFNIVLGGAFTTLLELTSAYSTIASGGVFRTPVVVHEGISCISDDCKSTYSAFGNGFIGKDTTVREIKGVLTSKTVEELDRMLLSVTAIGGTAEQLPDDIRGKTGTSGDIYGLNRDLSFIGYNSNGIVMGVWLGPTTWRENAGTASTSGLAVDLWDAIYKKNRKIFEVRYQKK